MDSADKRTTALKGLDLSGKCILEFGPLNRPLVPKAAGVYYADHCSTEDLRNKYANDPNVNVADIAEVDVDLTQMKFRDFASTHGPLDAVVASHVIEHIPDLISWLKDIHDALVPGGVLALVVPDKRFTFDLHRRETPLWRIEDDYEQRRTRPGLPVVLDHFCNVANVHQHTLWLEYRLGAEILPAHGNPSAFDPSHLIQAWHAGHYIDTHCLVVTPWRFVEIIGALSAKYDMPWHLKFIQPTAHNELEFYVQLQKGGEPTDWSARAADVRRYALRPELV
ncbi:class I SAM-dependent methyltransferase [Methylobacterium sp. E-025]|uniref:methyltransferase domain-containing protein n=1 Tax=Methylobacterium sp. E-025 TaxID=2836561 RepID=UPI001FB96BF6|nr:methyltransferase domain-containing protein [Methylobacterium sp. E-025]MCJ2112978.1 class I SAM-dependent methyltransferase [Methylobacterium sp. E-025]